MYNERGEPPVSLGSTGPASASQQAPTVMQLTHHIRLL